MFSQIKAIIALGMVIIGLVGCISGGGRGHGSGDFDFYIWITASSGGAPFYSEPGYDGAYLGRIPYDVELTVEDSVNYGDYDYRDVYYKVEYRGQTGWVSEYDTNLAPDYDWRPAKKQKEELPNWKAYEVFHQ